MPNNQKKWKEHERKRRRMKRNEEEGRPMTGKKAMERKSKKKGRKWKEG